jgi:flagellar biosynthesis protein FlhF
MRLKFLSAEDSREAAFRAAVQLGPSALLVDEEANADGNFASVIDGGAERPALSPMEVVEDALNFHDAPPRLVHRLIERKVRKGDALHLLESGLKALLKFSALPQAGRTRLMLVGPPAAGKSTLVGKLAARGTTPVARVLTTDITRPGGVEQLAEFVTVLGIDPERVDPAQQDLFVPATGPLLIDTAGLDAADTEGFAALGKLAERTAAEPILVIPALLDAGEARLFAESALAIGAKRVIATRLDIARRVGALIAAADAGLAISAGSITQHFSFGLKPLSPTVLAHHILELAADKAPPE